MNIPQGQCPKCSVGNSYDKTVCDCCGARLPWAGVPQNVQQQPQTPPVPPTGVQHSKRKLSRIGYAVAALLVLLCGIDILRVRSQKPSVSPTHPAAAPSSQAPQPVAPAVNPPAYSAPAPVHTPAPAQTSSTVSNPPTVDSTGENLPQKSSAKSPSQYVSAMAAAIENANSAGALLQIESRLIQERALLRQHNSEVGASGPVEQHFKMSLIYLISAIDSLQSAAMNKRESLAGGPMAQTYVYNIGLSLRDAARFASQSEGRLARAEEYARDPQGARLRDEQKARQEAQKTRDSIVDNFRRR